jgi:hypothetical protein
MIPFLALGFVLVADTTAYAVLNHGRPAGQMLVVRAGDTVTVKYHHYDRQRGPRSETRYRIRNGVVQSGETWQLPLYGPEPNPRPRPGDRFETIRDSIVWRVRDSVRSAPAPGSFYRLRSFTAYDQALLIRHLWNRPGRTARVLPSGTATLEVVADTAFRTRSGRQRARLVMIHGDRGNPSGVWLDDRNELIAGETSGWFVTVRPGSEELLPTFRSIEFAYRNARGAALARRLAPPVASSIAIVNGDVFDSERGVVLPRRTVVIRGERIIAVGPADSLAPPAGATVIDASGKTVMPGMWDMHTHAFLLSQSSGALAHLSIGVTSIRDLASDIDVATQYRDRSAKGEILAPHVVLGGFIEGPGRWAGPSEVIVRTEDEARAWVARYDSLGYKQIKLYNLVQQDLVPAIAEEARKRGMILSGHIPRGLSLQAAVGLGFNEINHAAFFFSTFFQDSLYVPQMRAYSTVSQIVAPHVNVDGPDVSAMIDLLKERAVIVDGTWNLWMSSRPPAAAAVAIPAANDQSLAQKADANYLRMLKRMFDAGLPIVAGTDGSSYNAELELYERAGIPANEVLRIATIVAARVMKDDRDYGSVAPGKVADILIVDGKPAERVSDLRKVERVVRAGRVYETKALRDALAN